MDAADWPRPEQRVRVRVRSHQPWGLSVEILGYEGVPASINYLDMAKARGRSREGLPEDYPVGLEFEATVRRKLGGPWPPRWIYLMVTEDQWSRGDQRNPRPGDSNDDRNTSGHRPLNQDATAQPDLWLSLAYLVTP